MKNRKPSQFLLGKVTNQQRKPQRRKLYVINLAIPRFFFFNFCKFDMQRMTSGFNLDFFDPYVYSSLMNCKCLLSIFSVGLFFLLFICKSYLEVKDINPLSCCKHLPQEKQMTFFFSFCLHHMK